MFSQLSHTLTKNLAAKTKKENGIYFTPKNIIQLIITFITNYIDNHNLNIKTILEPSCGSCEFIYALDSTFPNIEIDGIEYINDIYKNIKDLHFNNPVTIINNDYLNISVDKKYDLIIGNPPYYVVAKNKINKKYYQYFDGRPNIYIPFIIHSLNKLNPNGLLSYVLPKNFTNCLYYTKLRTFLYNTQSILQIIDCSDEKYIETGQETIILIVQNKPPLLVIDNDETQNGNDKFTIKLNNHIIFNTEENIVRLKEYYNDSTTLDKMGFNVKVGTVVWNQERKILTDDTSKTLLVYSSDIKDNILKSQKYKDIDKKNYIDKKGLSGPLLVVNRGYGKGKYVFNHCTLDIEGEYLIENHLICIMSKDKELGIDIKLAQYVDIINSFNSKKTQEFTKLYFGNNAINTTELQYILPIYNN